MSTIYESINQVMRDVTSLGKTQQNEYQGFNFRGIDDVMNHCGPAMRKHGVVATPIKVVAVTGEKELRNSTAKCVDLIVTIRWANIEGDYMDMQVAAEAFDSGDKATAKAMSVALRTAYLQTLCLPTEEADPDSFSYQLATNDQREAFIEELKGITDLDAMRRLQGRAKQFNAVKEWAEAGKALASAGGASDTA